MKNKDRFYLNMAKLISEQSYAERLKVGCVIVKEDNVIGYGYNGTPKGFNNLCEMYDFDSVTKSKPEVIHAEMNAIAKCAKSTQSCEGATMYCTDSPCPECCKLIIASGIVRVVYDQPFRDVQGLEWLKQANIEITML